MDDEQVGRVTCDELASRAERGLGGQGAVVEAMFELKGTIEKQTKATTKLDNKMFWLNVVILFLTVVQVLVAFNVVGGR